MIEIIISENDDNGGRPLKCILPLPVKLQKYIYT